MSPEYLNQFEPVIGIYVWTVASIGIYPTREQAERVARRYRRLWKTRMFARKEIITISDLADAIALRRELKKGRIKNYQNEGSNNDSNDQ